MLGIGEWRGRGEGRGGEGSGGEWREHTSNMKNYKLDRKK